MRDDRERRVLVFGEEEALQLRAEPGGPTRVLHIERFFDDDDRLYLFGFMEEQDSRDTIPPIG
ncbi:MAG: hypothetical protein U5N27_14925 [Rhizobium sp.]|nr:hypothetical protein [Rhizobium sp.]